MEKRQLATTLSASTAHKQALVVLAALLTLGVSPVQAATRYWDGGNADIPGNGNGDSEGGSGTWNTLLKNWDQGNGLARVAWTNGGNVAEIDGISQTLTLGANIVLGGIVQKSGGSNVAIGGPFTLTLNNTGANTFLAAANATTGRTLTVNAVIAGAVGKNFVIAGPGTSGTGTINLGAANTFSGTTSFNAGATGGARVYLRNRLALQNSTVILSSDANVIFDEIVSTDTFTFGGLSASSAGTGFNLALRNDATTPSPITLTVGGNNSSTTYRGVLSSGGSLIKTGTGTLTLAGTNTYTGTTAVNLGTMQIDGSTTSATAVNNGATLAGNGLVSAAVTVNTGGTLAPGANNLTVNSLNFSSTGSIKIGTLSNYTSVAAIQVNNAITLSGGAGAVTLNLPTALGFNGTYRLIQFGSGLANTNGFTLGTVPTLAWNQTGSLQLSGNFLNYVITAVGDTTPPTLRSTVPANNANNVLASADLVATFDETIVRGSGTIELRKFSDGSLIESFNVATSTKLTFSTTQLIINPTNNLPTNQTYYVLIPDGALKDTSGNNYAGIINNTGWKFTVPTPAVLFTDTGSPANPLWSAILPTLNNGFNDNDPVPGSTINVSNAVVETGLYGDRPISLLGTGLRLHVACHTSTSNVGDFSRWFQTDGNTHMLRVFVNDENTATNREGTSSHTEAFMGGGWNYTDNMTYEWTARYTIARLEQGYSCFQLKNIDDDWAVQLSIGTNGSLTVNNRIGTDTVVTNPDGSVKNFSGGGFDVRVLDDGLNYKLWIDGVLYASSSYTRLTSDTTFRWGMYFGANKLNPPATYNVILVSGVQVKSWPGRLTNATATRTKDNNTTNLNNPLSWVDDVAPGIHDQALWNSTVTGSNSTTLAIDQQWAGLKIVNPGGFVSINGSATLSLNDAGIDMSAATRNLDVNCPVLLSTASNWNVASGIMATFDGPISGYPGLTLTGAGTVRLNAANTFSGVTTVSAGTLIVNNNSALSDGLLMLNGGHLSNTTSCTLGNDINVNSNANINVASSQTFTLNGSLASTGTLTKIGAGKLVLSGANTHTGATIVNAGTLAIGNPTALLTTSSLTLAGGTLLQPNLDGIVLTAPITVGTSGTTATISAPTNAPGGGVPSTLTLKSPISGSGRVTFSSSANLNALSTVYLGAQSTYAGSTLLDTAGTSTTQIIVKLGIHNALPTTTVLTIDGQPGTGTSPGRFAELNLNGFNQQLAGLTNTPQSLRAQRVVNSNISAPSTLTINNSANLTFSGNLGSDTANGSVAGGAIPGSINGNNFALTKSGAGTFTLPGAHTYSGNTTISAGILSVGNNLTMQNSALNTSGSILGNATNGLRTTATSLTLGGLIGDKNLASIFTTTSGGYSGVTALTLDTDTGVTLNYSGVIANGATGMTLTKSGQGTQTLSGANTYTGLTTVTNGTLILSGNRTAASGGIQVGVNAVATVNQTAGTIAFASGNTDQLLVGNGNGHGIYNLSGGTLTTVAVSNRGIILGVNTGASGTFNLSNTGTLTMPSGSVLQISRCQDSAATGTTGIFNQTGGTATVGELRMGGSTAGAANNANSTAQLNLSAGTFSAASFTQLSGGNTSSSIINISGTANVTLPKFPTGRGTSSTATVTFDGGTLRNLVADTTYMGGLTHAFIKDGGATFDTTNGSITISQPLLTDPVSTGGGLTKNGSNTLTLSGLNTYSGDTTVNGGTLVLGFVNSNNLSTVKIAASGALLKLNFAGTDHVGSLLIGTTYKPVGVYGHSSTNATNGGLGVGAMDAYFVVGTGTLTVSTPPPTAGYVFWATTNAPTTGNNPNGDEDGDGVPNSIECVLGGTINTNDANKLPTSTYTNGNFIFTFKRDQASIDGTTVVEIETSPELTDWSIRYTVPNGATANNPGVTVQKNIPVLGQDTITLTLPGTAPNKYARLKVTR